MNVSNSMLPLLDSMKTNKQTSFQNANWGRKMKTTPASLEFSREKRERSQNLEKTDREIVMPSLRRNRQK